MMLTQKIEKETKVLTPDYYIAAFGIYLDIGKVYMKWRNNSSVII